MAEREIENRLVVVSNRLPVVVNSLDGGEWDIKPGSGGLVTALAPVLRNRGGVWIGWPGVTEEQAGGLTEALAHVRRNAGYDLTPVLLSAEERDKYYYGFSNEVLWPLFHDLQTLCNFDPEYWQTYQQVQGKFAQVITENMRPNDFVWVHDYQLMGVASAMRQMGVESHLGFFLHTPFPPMDIFIKMPWRFEVLNALLQYDLIGVQTLRDRRNLVQCLRLLIEDANVKGKGQVITIHTGGRDIRLGSFPIGIDFQEFAKHAASQEVAEQAWYLHEDFPERKIVLGVDRLDYTKGIPYKLRAFQNLLTRYPEMRKQISLVQILVPSREYIPQYQELKEEIERMVGEINGQFAESDWVPIHYLFRSLDRTELLAYYRTAEIGLVTPLKDGMNLVAKEFCTCDVEGDSVLILSEFAGTVAQMQKCALLVNPYDVEGTADAIYEAFHMSHEDRKRRMRHLKRIVRRQDIYWWVDSFLRAAIAKNLKDFPILDDYLPQYQEDVSEAEFIIQWRREIGI